MLKIYLFFLLLGFSQLCRAECNEILSEKQLSNIVENSKIEAFKQKLENYIVEKKNDHFRQLFHSGVKMTEGDALAFQKNIYQTFGRVKNLPFEHKFKIVLESPTKDYQVCSPDFSVLPQSGFNIQYPFVFKIDGIKSEGQLGVLAGIEKKELRILAIHAWLSKHSGLSLNDWMNKALAADKLKQELQMLIYLNASLKMLVSSEPFFKRSPPQNLLDLLKKIDGQGLESTDLVPFSNQNILNFLKEKTNISSLQYASSSFSTDGVGLFLRFKNNEQEKQSDLRESCLGFKKIFAKNFDLIGLSGMRCSVLTKNENINQDGKAGSLFLSF